MTTQANADFLKRLIATFLVEAREHVQALGAGLLELHTASGREALLPQIETLFREAHSLKGAARAVSAHEIECLCQTIEHTFSTIKAGGQALTTEVIEGLHRSVTDLGQRVEVFAAGSESAAPAVSAAAPLADLPTPAGEAAQNPPHRPPDQPAATGLEAAAASADSPLLSRPAASGLETPAPTAAPRLSSPPPAPGAPAPYVPPGASRRDAADTVRIAASKLDAIFLQAEELLEVKLAWAERALELRALAGLVAERERLWNEAVPLVRDLREQLAVRQVNAGAGAMGRAAAVELPSRLLGLFDRDREHAEVVSRQVADFAHRMAADRRRFDALLERLLEDTKGTLMLPFSTLLVGFPKMVHDLARDAGKDIAFVLRGSDIEIDKRILERIKDALVHVVRNSIDHGIEVPAERVRRGKAPGASLTLVITQPAGKVEIRVTDDGAGIDGAAVKAAAVAAGAVSVGEADALSDQAAIQLIFRSGVTTRREVTALSGRGLGMAIVKDSVAGLGGTVSVESTLGVGTTTRIILPLTLATLRGTLVRVAHREFVIPTANVVRVLRVERTAVCRVENRDSLCVDGTTLSLVRLAAVLGLSSSGPVADRDRASLTLLVLGHGEMSIAFVVDQVVGEQEVLAKPLGPILPQVRNLAGATVSGAGRVVPILNVADLLESARACAQGSCSEAESAPPAPATRVLVVDDSITTRTVLQSILGSAGYDVKTAPDGSVALSLLRAEAFDLVVSDVEMPRMDGFDLTRCIRADPALAELPVVLVTARQAPEDRERGVGAGANAYVVKGSFDQGDLLAVIRRLV